MASDPFLDSVRDLARRGATHFHASYVAKQADIPIEKARERLEELREEGLIDVHFEVICPNCDRTIKSFDLGEKIPLGETIEDEDCDAEPFELREDDLLVTYSPSRKLLLKLNREKGPEDAKKKTSRRLGRPWKIFSTLRRFTRSGRKRESMSSSTVPARRSRKPSLMAQR